MAQVQSLVRGELRTHKIHGLAKIKFKKMLSIFLKQIVILIIYSALAKEFDLCLIFTPKLMKWVLLWSLLFYGWGEMHREAK